MNHSDIQSRMASYLDGELSLDARALFDAHLDRCETCSRELNEMRDTIRLLRSLPTPEPPADLVSQVMSRIAEGEGQPGWFGRAMDQLSRVIVPRIAIPATAVAAALTLTVVSGDLSLRSLDPRVRPSPSEIAGIALEVRGHEPAGNALPVPAGLPRIGGESRALAGITVRVTSPTPPLHYKNESGAGSFLFRVANDQLGPIRRQPSEGDVAGRYMFTSHAREIGPYLGASAAPPISLGAGQYIMGGAKSRQNGEQRVGGAMVPASASSVVSGGRLASPSREQLLDRRLRVLVSDPPGFASRQAKRSLAEQEHWLLQMAARAVEIGDVERVMSALAGSGDPEAKELARKFNQAVLRNSENIANANRGSNDTKSTKSTKSKANVTAPVNATVNAAVSEEASTGSE